jgi:hypothetical protein
MYGTQMDPLFKCDDILMHVLGYDRTTNCKWFRTV